MPKFEITFARVRSGQRETIELTAKNSDEAEKVCRQENGEPIHVLKVKQK